MRIRTGTLLEAPLYGCKFIALEVTEVLVLDPPYKATMVTALVNDPRGPMHEEIVDVCEFYVEWDA